MTKISYNDLGAFPPAEEAVPEVDSPEKVRKPSALYRMVQEVYQAHPDSVVLVQVGSFYELYYDQAISVASKLNLKLAKKSSVEGPIPMAGFPCYQLDRYLRMLVSELEYTVVLYDQFELPSTNGNKNIERRLSRIVTAGTLINESFVDSQRGNYLAAVVFTNAHLEKEQPLEESPVALAWLDLSVGEFQYQSTTLKDLTADLARIHPKELLLDSDIRRFNVESGQWFSDLAELKAYNISYQSFPDREEFSKYTSLLTDSTSASAEYKADLMGHKEFGAVAAIMSYVRENLPATDIKLNYPTELQSSKIMRMDSRSLDALEIFEGPSSTVRGTLFSTIRRTVTPSGQRLLGSWLAAPQTDLDEINRRLQLVEYFLQNVVARSRILQEIRNMEDCTRVLQKLTLRRADPMDLVSIANCINIINNISKIIRDDIKEYPSSYLAQFEDILEQHIEGPKRLAKNIQKCIDTDALITMEENSDGNAEPSQKPQKVVSIDSEMEKRVIKRSASVELDRLYEDYETFAEKRQELQRSLAVKQKPGVQVSLRWSPKLLYHVHAKLLKSATMDDIQVEGTVLSQTKNSRCIQYPEWSSMGTNRESLLDRKQAIETKILNRLQQYAIKYEGDIRRCCEVVDELDVLISFATLANERNLVRPVVKEEPGITIKNGRHMSVEEGLRIKGFDFVGNDCQLSNDDDSSSVWVITGPNMGGKSTFIRQVAIICILAQIGCFVPAQSAEIGVVDKVFCRIGAADDLYRDRSTFMVEMLETSTILRNATPNSLAILDEVGRGTSGQDGLAIAYAVILHLCKTNQCHALFATHFGRELSNLLNANGHDGLVEYYHTDLVDEPADAVKQFYFNYKLSKGICKDSNGLKIAALAGFPRPVLETAEEALETLRSVGGGE